MNRVESIDRYIDPKMEARLMHDLEPIAVDSYETHMTTGPRKIREYSQAEGENISSIAGTLDPLEEVYRAAGIEPQDRITQDLVGAVHDSFESHISSLEKQGLDARTPIRIGGRMTLGTENGLVWFHSDQQEFYKDYPVYAEGLARWTAEEADHGPLIELYGSLSGAISPKEAHAVKVAINMGGIKVNTNSIVAIDAFTDPQEGDTVDAHSDLGSTTDLIGRRIMNKIAGHEDRHRKWFRQNGKGIYSLGQECVDYALPIEAETHRTFAMPAEGSYPDFVDDAIQIAVYGLFTTSGVLARQKERVEDLGLLDLKVTTEAAKKAQAKIAKSIDPESRINKLVLRKVEQATERYIESEKSQGRVPFILGRTVVVSGKELKVIPEAA